MRGHLASSSMEENSREIFQSSANKKEIKMLENMACRCSIPFSFPTQISSRNRLQFPSLDNLRLLLPLLLNLQRRELKRLTHTPLNLLPPPKLNLRRPSQNTHPWLHIIVYFQHHVFRFREFACRSRDLVFRFLILQFEFAPALISAFPSHFPFPIATIHGRGLTSKDQYSSPSRSSPTSSSPPAQYSADDPQKGS